MQRSPNQLNAALMLSLAISASAYAINPVGTSTNHQDYYDLANNTDDFLGVGLISVPGAACTGAWLGDDIVLTARHCGGEPDSIAFTFPNGTAIGSIGHWPSNVAGNHNDLAIVQLATTPNLPPNYVPGKIRPNNDGIVGQLATLVGYGGIGRSAGDNTVQYGATTGEIGAHRPAATSLTLGANLIPGDSGGPLFVQEQDDTYSIVGVAAVIFGNTDVWANPVAYAEQIEFVRQTNNFLFFQDGLPIPDVLGDLTLDGIIDGNDVDAFVNGWRENHAGLNARQAWQLGDLNGDRTTNLEDWSILVDEYPRMARAIAGRLFATPEPSSMTLVLGALACIIHTRLQPPKPWRRQ